MTCNKEVCNVLRHIIELEMLELLRKCSEKINKNAVAANGLSERLSKVPDLFRLFFISNEA